MVHNGTAQNCGSQEKDQNSGSQWDGTKLWFTRDGSEQWFSDSCSRTSEGMRNASHMHNLVMLVSLLIRYESVQE